MEGGARRLAGGKARVICACGSEAAEEQGGDTEQQAQACSNFGRPFDFGSPTFLTNGR